VTETDLGYWVMSGEALLEMLREVAAGADPDLVYAENYANADMENYRNEERALTVRVSSHMAEQLKIGMWFNGTVNLIEDDEGGWDLVFTSDEAWRKLDTDLREFEDG
jgi:hypothetical protein